MLFPPPVCAPTSEGDNPCQGYLLSAISSHGMPSRKKIASRRSLLSRLRCLAQSVPRNTCQTRQPPKIACCEYENVLALANASPSMDARFLFPRTFLTAGSSAATAVVLVHPNALERSGPNLRTNSWTETLVRQHWKLVSHSANLTEHRWVRQVFAWNPSVRYRSFGRRPHTWDYQIPVFWRYKGLGSWLEESLECTLKNFLRLRQIACKSNVHNPVFLFTACAPNGLALWRAAIDR